jgi:hypothetical protein
MLEDILGDAYEPDMSRTTARSARLAQITNDYTAATLARSQPDAPPPHIPFCSNTSQSDQSPPKLRQSAQAHPPPDTERSRPASSAKYEHISLSKVGARPIRPSSHTDIRQNKPPLPEQQADEPRFVLQNIATKPSHRRESESSPPPIHPVQPPAATEATPSSVVAKEATPPPVVAEAPPSPPVAQQQPAPPSFCPLNFKPFSSLLTSYRVPASLSSPVCVPDLRRQSPPQPHQPTRKPSPADTAEPARSATPVETVLAQAISSAVEPEISEERAAHRAEEPEEPERDEEPQEDKLSDYASQSSPSSSFPETSPQCRPSALAFIAPLAESL